MGAKRLGGGVHVAQNLNYSDRLEDLGLRFSIVTTIQAPTTSVLALARFGHQFDIPVLAVGDRKSPVCDWPRGSEFLSLAHQKSMSFRLAELLPVDHYSRKNLGYLEAIARGAALHI